jgi:hypothetical protein
MKTVFMLSPPLLEFIVATRAALGVGLGLLAAGRIPEHRRRTIGFVLVAIGLGTTIPAMVSVFSSRTRTPIRPR